MKKTCHRFFLPLFLLWMLGAAVLPAHADSYASGVAAYKQKNYVKAAELFNAAVRENPKDPPRLFYMGLAYTQTGKYEEARQAFVILTQMLPPSDPLAVKARNNISVLTEKQMHAVSNNNGHKADAIIKASHSSDSKPNYLTHVIQGGKVTHFDTARMPLKVFISDGNGVAGWTPEMKTIVTNAMSTWQAATRGKVRFARTYTEGEADIVVRWRKSFTDNHLGVSAYKLFGNTLAFTDVQLATHYPDSSVPIPLKDLSPIVIHEFGHAIGIKGHSPYPQDVMYFSTHPSQSTQLTSRDVNTINMLYGFEADVQNAAGNVKQTTQYLSLIEKGQAEMRKGQYGSAQSYLRQAVYLNQKSPEAKYMLAVALYNQGIDYAQGRNAQQARNNFLESTRLLQEVVASPKPPDDARDLLNRAQKNLSVMDAAMR